MIHMILLLVAFGAVSISDLLLGVNCIRKGSEKGRWLGATCLASFGVTVSYLLSILVKDYFVYSLLSSLYFAGIDITLLCLLQFIRTFAADTPAAKPSLWQKVMMGYAIFDIAVLAINPFCEIGVHYLPREGTIVSHYSYQMLLLLWLHLIFAYLIVGIVLYFLMAKLLHVPRNYQGQYHYAMLTILAVVAINAVYLYWPGPQGYDYLDYSLLGYSIAAFLLYWTTFNYSSHGMMRTFHSWIFQNIDQGIVLFDYNNRMMMYNVKAAEMLPANALGTELPLDTFMEACGIKAGADTSGDHYTFKCMVRKGEALRPLRCDYSAQFSEHREVMGRLFVFSELSMENDMVTGFYTLGYVAQHPEQFCEKNNRDCVVVLCDINGLAELNSVHGRDAGDQMILHLAEMMRRFFPKNTQFVRGQEASLAAICCRTRQSDIEENLERVKLAMEERSVNIQYAMSRVKNDDTVLDAIKKATQVLRTKKLLDRKSRHSESLNSLIQALQECDKETEQHVQRTQNMGAALGRRIGLSDEEQSNLALLALLHDIGKIGIPLDILNKPGKLTEAEWEVLKTHAEKGYQIAASSQELKDIADMIRYHHERWDGRGYPEGLVGERIPLLSRIISVVDAYDAMTNDRAYRRAFPEAKARAELRRCAGTQFDPRIVSEFIELLKEIDARNGVIVSDEAAPEAADDQQVKPRSVDVMGLQMDELRVHDLEHAVYVTEGPGLIVSVDSSFEKLTGYSQADVKEKKLTQMDLIFHEDWDDYLRMIKESNNKSSIAYFEHRIRCKDGGVKYVFCMGRRYYDSAERKERTELIVSDCSNSYTVRTIMSMESGRNNRNQELPVLRRDAMAELLGPAAFRACVEPKLKGEESHALMLVIDVDNFKEYNDTHGQHAGDEHLNMVAQALMGALCEDDQACRIGGDEFAAILFYRSEVTKEAIIRRAQQICDRINMTLVANEQNAHTISIGGAFKSEQCSGYEQMQAEAIKALGRAKENGRARFSL